MAGNAFKTKKKVVKLIYFQQQKTSRKENFLHKTHDLAR